MADTSAVTSAGPRPPSSARMIVKAMNTKARFDAATSVRSGINAIARAIEPSAPVTIQTRMSSVRLIALPPSRPARLLPVRSPTVEGQIQREDVDAGLAEQAEEASLSVLIDEGTHSVRRELALSGYPRHLVEGRGRADVGIESATRRGHEIDGHRSGVPRVGRVEGVHAPLQSGDQRRVRRAQVRAGRRGRLVAERARGGRPAPEVLRLVEGLPDEGRAQHLPVLDDQAPVGLGGKTAWAIPVTTSG